MTTKKITGDHSRFRKIISGKLNERMSKFIKTGHILKMRPNGKGKMSIPLPQIDQYNFRHGKMDEGAARGPGKDGETIDKEYEPGYGPGGKAGDQDKEGILVDVEVEDVLQMMEQDLQLPRMKPKNSQTYENTEIKYIDISKTGPRSLIHRKRSIKQAIKRNIAQGTFGEKVLLPGFNSEIPIIKINKEDFYYRQWEEVKVPRANALIVFGRDGSGSMDDFKCNLVSDLSWWIDTWIRRDYKKTETLYLWHDTEAKEVSQHDFYHLRHGGGTKASSIVNLLKKLIEIKYSPKMWNIYFFYFGDGDNWSQEDNKSFFDVLKEMEDNINLFGMGQILADRYQGSLKSYVDSNINYFKVKDFARTVSIGGDKGDDDDDDGPFYEGDNSKLDEDMKKAIVKLLGNRSYEDTDTDLYYNNGAVL